MASIVTLTTDFGTQDGYVAEMKGVMLSLNPALTLVDVTHEIAPQDVQQGAYVLSTIAWRFPRDTVHLSVVDPGVGTDRRAIAAVCRGCVFIGPDNGLLTPVLVDPGLEGVREITNPEVIASCVSRTFHGRDVFAPAAAHASKGSSVYAFGPPVTDAILLDAWELAAEESRILGRVIHVDRFGNLITNIRADMLTDRAVAEVRVGGSVLIGLQTAYGRVREGESLALVGSQDTIEVSVNGGNASEALGVTRGAEVEVRFAI